MAQGTSSSVRSLNAALVCFVLLPATAPPALAAIADTSASQALADPEQIRIEKELKAFEHVRVSARDAVLAAEMRVRNARVVDIGFAAEDGAPVYRLMIDRNGRLSNTTIDAITREIIVDAPQATVTAEDRHMIAAFRLFGMSLSEAITIAETYATGKAVSATLDQSDGQLSLLVVVVSNGQLSQVSIDATNRSVRRKASQAPILNR